MRPAMILHLKLDTLPTHVILAAHPELQEIPFVIAHTGHSTRVLDISLVAQRLGLRREMPLAQAQAQVPGLRVIAPDNRAQHQVFLKFIEIILRFTPQLQPLSLTEILADVTRNLLLFGGVDTLLETLRATVMQELGLCLSIGVGPNPLIAKLATLCGNCGETHQIPAASLPGTLTNLPISLLWTVDDRWRQRLVELGVKTFGELRAVPSILLHREFGQLGEVMFKAARGRDDTIVSLYMLGDPELSLRRRVSMARPTSERDALLQTSAAVAQMLGKALRGRGQAARLLALEINLRDGRRIQRQRALPVAINDEPELVLVAQGLVSAALSGIRYCVTLELIASDLIEAVPAHQLSLFEAQVTPAVQIEELKQNLRAEIKNSETLRAAG